MLGLPLVCIGATPVTVVVAAVRGVVTGVVVRPAVALGLAAAAAALGHLLLAALAKLGGGVVNAADLGLFAVQVLVVDGFLRPPNLSPVALRLLRGPEDQHGTGNLFFGGLDSSMSAAPHRLLPLVRHGRSQVL